MPSPQDQYDEAAERRATGTDPASVRYRVETMERLLERMFVIPGINRPVGFDVLFNIIPFAGDLLATVLGSWIIWEARNLGMSKLQMARMAANVGFDMLISAIPFVGAIPDLFFRSNSRNLRIILRHLDKHHPATRTIEGEAVRLD